MRVLYTKCRIENPVDRGRVANVRKILVDTGSEYSWIPEPTLERLGIEREKKDVAFVRRPVRRSFSAGGSFQRRRNGQEITRSVGFGIVRIGKFFTIDEIVFAERGDLVLLGARTLEGLNLTVDPTRKRLVAAGPIPAAGARR